MSALLTAPILLPLAASVAALAAFRHVRAQEAAGLAGPVGLLASGVALLVVVDSDGVQATQVGDWPAPFGITLVADRFSAIMVVLAGIVGTAAAVFSVASVDRTRTVFGYYTLTNVLLAGVAGAFLTGDLFNLYVWFEVLLIASFVLLALGGSRAQTAGAIKYVALNLVGSLLFLAGTGLVYALTGTLNMADLAGRLAATENEGLVTAIAMLFLVAFGIKAAAFPLFMWLPASYHTPPGDVTALFAGLLTKVGVYALIRTFTLLFVQEPSITHEIILALAAFTMVSGVLGAIAQVEFRRILSFHIVSQIGYALFGLGVLTPLALGAAIFFLIHNVLAKTALLFVSGAVELVEGSPRLAQLGGLYERRPALAVAFAAGALSLGGIPPLAGFVAKLGLVRAGVEEGEYLLVGVALGVSLLTLLSMNKIWSEAFWKAPPEPRTATEPAIGRARLAVLTAPALVLAGMGVALGLGAAPIFDLALRAGEELFDPVAYREAVLGGAA